MLNVSLSRLIRERLRQGHRTIPFPQGARLPARFRGRPILDRNQCPDDCRACEHACPTGAIEERRVDLGRCLFCTSCTEACPSGAVAFRGDYRLATRRREDLLTETSAFEPEERIKKLFGRSLKLRQVSAGGCNACEADVNVLGTVAYDLGRFGIQFVASPRHADGILITGPVSENMRTALLDTYEAVPAPKIVIAVGSCAISGGLFRGFSETHDGAASLVPVDLFIPGCPPHPLTILDGILRFLGRGDAEQKG